MAGIAIDAEALRIARLRKGWTLRHVAERCKELDEDAPVDRSNLNKYERGILRPEAPTLLAIATALDMDVADLVLPRNAA